MTNEAIVAFTGPSRLNEVQSDWCENEIRFLDLEGDPLTIRTGAAHGLDTVAAMTCLTYFDFANNELYVPAANWNTGLPIEEFSRVVYCAERPDAASAYRTRNAAMLADATKLIAFLWKDEFYRSGEWMTVNIAEREGIEVVKIILPA